MLLPGMHPVAQHGGGEGGDYDRYKYLGIECKSRKKYENVGKDSGFFWGKMLELFHSRFQQKKTGKTGQGKSKYTVWGFALLSERLFDRGGPGVKSQHTCWVGGEGFVGASGLPHSPALHKPWGQNKVWRRKSRHCRCRWGGSLRGAQPARAGVQTQPLTPPLLPCPRLILCSGCSRAALGEEEDRCPTLKGAMF